VGPVSGGRGGLPSHCDRNLTPASSAECPCFRALSGSAASEGVFASSLDVRSTRTSALDLPPRKAPPGVQEAVAEEAVQRRRRGCSGPRMPGSSGNGPLGAGPPPMAAPHADAPLRGGNRPRSALRSTPFTGAFRHPGAIGRSGVGSSPRPVEGGRNHVQRNRQRAGEGRERSGEAPPVSPGTGRPGDPTWM
jgi:hypothetical protein